MHIARTQVVLISNPLLRDHPTFSANYHCLRGGMQLQKYKHGSRDHRSERFLVVAFITHTCLLDLCYMHSYKLNNSLVAIMCMFPISLGIDYICHLFSSGRSWLPPVKSGARRKIDSTFYFGVDLPDYIATCNPSVYYRIPPP